MSEDKVIDGELVEETAIVPHMIRPIVGVEDALKAWKEYQALKTKLADKGDFVDIQGKKHPTKQFAKKLQKFFGLSTEIIDMHEENDGKEFTWYVTARATAPNGQYNDGDGACSSDERGFVHKKHDVRATAVTRAKNRAILELAGFGEVSAEEITEDTQSKPKRGLMAEEDGGGRREAKESAHVGSGTETPDRQSKTASPMPPSPTIANGTNEELAEAINTKLREAGIKDEMIPKLFKPWLERQVVMNKKTGKKRIFLGDNFGNLSFRMANNEDLKYICKNFNNMIDDFYKEVLPHERRDK